VGQNARVPLSWDGSVVVVTGASRGIGREVAEAASARGAVVGLVARSQSDLDLTLAAIGGRGATAVADVGEPHQLQAAIERLTAALGPVDILVNNAGIGAYGSFADAGPDVAERLMRTNYLGAVHATRAVVGSMIQRHRGHIVMVGSIAGRLGAPFEAAYSASKFAMTGLTEALAVELAPHGIGVSMVNPGPVATGFFETRGVPYARRFPRPVTPQRVAAAVMTAVERNRLEMVVPRWLRVGMIVRILVPGLYVRGATRATAPTTATQER
jgi:short-subunit dehydrogenase